MMNQHEYTSILIETTKNHLISNTTNDINFLQQINNKCIEKKNNINSHSEYVSPNTLTHQPNKSLKLCKIHDMKVMVAVLVAFYFCYFRSPSLYFCNGEGENADR